MRLLLALVLSAFLAAACASGGDAATSGTDAASGGGGGAPSITVDDFKFIEETTQAKVGEEVTWTVAEGSSPHTVKFEDEESEELAAGDTYKRTFDTAGEQKFVCGIHPGMSGTVAVE